MKWLNVVGSQVLSLAHAAGGCERNWRTHTIISSDLRQSLSTSTSSLERYVKLHKNMRLRDRATSRGLKAKKEKAAEPKPYPLESGDWSSCDESDEDSAWDPVVAAMAFGP